ncbi:hypothetical protein BJN34_36540 (plasmid) [Cupriavidus necator]|uniref:Uncharacterized protein n=1 Tax=Cupriavidus necator TaxID=106590 RepID=A0A1U9V362_CUPNE|nr:hypothetical protein [Cupriavidus necator]AQV99386.1 hypothetical protein BJN34_36540 [Cupriavidus necator]
MTKKRGKPEAPWWEDIWDTENYAKHEYWPGWRQLCAKILRAVEMKSLLDKERKLIRSGLHEALSSMSS